MSSTTAQDLFILVVLSILLVVLLPRAWNMLRIYSGIRARRLEDSSSSAPPMPPAVAVLAHRLGGLGFSRIGERSTELPGRGRVYEWDLVDAPTTTYIALVSAPSLPGGVLMVCYTAFGDGAFASTSFPSGATIDRSDLVAGPIATTPENAVAAHAERVARFAPAHGRPLPNRSMADLLQRDATYRTRHGGLTIRTRVYRFTALTGLVALATFVVLVRLVAFDR